MRIIVKCVLIVAFIGCLIWALIKPNFDSISAAITSLGMLLATFIKTRKAHLSQSQVVGTNAMGIQSGRDVKIQK